jgi:hypothetical protein
MITITNEESKMILEMLFENPETQDAAAQARRLRDMPSVMEDIIRHVAGDDRNILLTLLAMVCLAAFTVQVAEKSPPLLESLVVAASIDKKVLKEICRGDLPLRLGYLAEEIYAAQYMNDEPVGNC